MTTTIPAGGRIQLALRVEDLERAIAFYGTLFDAEPAKIRSGYANFAIDEPPLKLVLIEGKDGGRVDHLGVEVATTTDVDAAATRLKDAGLATFDENNVECCYARQDKVWIHSPDGEPWEIYTVLEDSDVMEKETEAVADRCCDPLCCA